MSTKCQGTRNFTASIDLENQAKFIDPKKKVGRKNSKKKKAKLSRKRRFMFKIPQEKKIQLISLNKVI